MAQASREKKISQIVQESQAKSRKVCNLRKEVKHLRKKIVSLQNDAEFETRLSSERIEAAAKVLLHFHPLVEVEPADVYNGIAIYTWHEIEEAFQLDETSPRFDYNEQSAMWKAFMIHMDAAFYADEKHNFSFLKAAFVAKQAGKRCCVVENLS